MGIPIAVMTGTHPMSRMMCCINLYVISNNLIGYMFIYLKKNKK